MGDDRRVCRSRGDRLVHSATEAVRDQIGWLVGWWLNVPATCECISGTEKLQIKRSHLVQSQKTDTGPARPSNDPTTPGAWPG